MKLKLDMIKSEKSKMTKTSVEKRLQEKLVLDGAMGTELEKLGVKVVITKSKNNRVNLQSLMIELGKIGIDGILLEGGATLSFSALEENIVDKIQVYIAPKIIGGEKSKTSIGGQGIKKLSDAIELKDMTVKSISPDLLVEAYLRGGEK